MSIGDINSRAAGSGARYNDGKPALELIPLGFLAETFNAGSRERKVMESLALFQAGGFDDVLRLALNEATAGDFTDCARVFDYGRKKYAEWNWAKGMPWSVPLGSAARHLVAISKQEDVDAESGLSHWGHVACNIIMLMTYRITYRDGDDRPTCLKGLLDGF